RQGGEFLVNTHTTQGQLLPSVAMDANGDFVIACISGGQDGSFSGVYAQLYNAAGVPQEGEFLVNTFTTDSQSRPSVAMDADGDFVVAWGSYGQDGSGSGVYAQRYFENTAPTLADPGARTVNEGTPLSFTLLGADPNLGDALVFSIAAGALPGMTLDPATGLFSWTPTEAQDGAAVVTFRVSDGSLVTERTITITVAEVANPPGTPPPGAMGNRAPVLATRAIRPITVGTRGFRVASLLRGRVVDADVGARQGIAVTRLTGTGRWQYQRGGRGAWRAIPRPTSSRPFLLAADARLRFAPTGSNRTGTLRFRAWDQTAGRANTRFRLSTGAVGGSGAFSVAQATARVTGTVSRTATGRSATPTLSTALLDAVLDAVWTEAAAE
ncbi:MAG: Ig domain-containing protein, partial [Planctomycetia bacterium]